MTSEVYANVTVHAPWYSKALVRLGVMCIELGKRLMKSEVT